MYNKLEYCQLKTYYFLYQFIYLYKVYIFLVGAKKRSTRASGPIAAGDGLPGYSADPEPGTFSIRVEPTPPDSPPPPYNSIIQGTDNPASHPTANHTTESDI